ncbi:glycosyltransferase family 4 protein [Brevibacterium casei]|uniref:D-inositol 3-phosphate glycosyltransferase n=1 Tax=Brevibacterium casei CIP 102111 TaxID=1255625 RepID=A0A2H1JJH8_9MICO|nr:glycosyltransferase family 4 protein [Brevibacterium casei]SMX87666.1 Glycosyltransferase involved in cell wall bisynthesis [Brevibacterium casei CIP 102111]
MNLGFLSRQVVNATATTLAHINEDRVFFAMQLARRLPKSASKAVGAILSRIPKAASRAAGAWLLGQETAAKAIVAEHEAVHPTRLLGEIALNLGLVDSASRIAEGVSGGQALRSRILWTVGNVDASIEALPPGRRRTRLEAERATLASGWWPHLDAFVTARASSLPPSSTHPSSMHVLTNSLPHTRSGYAYRSHLILRTLQDSGHSVIAATRTSYPVTIGRLGSGAVESVDGVDYLRHVPLLPPSTPTERLLGQARWIADEAVRRDTRILHTTTHYVNGLITGAAARAVGLPWVYEVRGVLEETWAAAGASSKEQASRRTSQRFALMRAKEIEVAKRADAVITLGETMRAHLIENGIDEDSITVIPNSVSEAVVSADVSRSPAEVRASLGLPTDGVWVGTAASIVGYEGLDDLVEAVRIARSKGIDLRLLVAGDGVALPDLRERANVLGDAAVFTGRVSQSAAIDYQLALDTIVVPRKDTQVCRLVTPIKPIEAMGLGRPVVVSDLPALREMVPEAAGLRSGPENPRQLADTLAELALDSDARVRFGNNGREYVLASRRWKDIGQRYGEVYARIVGAEAK